jgi:hypothetical protein
VCLCASVCASVCAFQVHPPTDLTRSPRLFLLDIDEPKSSPIYGTDEA